MDKNYEKRMLLAFVLSFVLFGITFFLIPKKEDKPKDYTAQVQQTNTNANAALTTNVTYNTAATNAAPVKKPATTSAISNVYETLPITEAKIGYSNQLSLTVSSFAGRWANVQINGKWNRLKEPISFVSDELRGRPGDFVLGEWQNAFSIPDRIQFQIVETNADSVLLTGSVKIKTIPVKVSRRYTTISNYQIVEEITFRNEGNEMVNMDFGGKSFSVFGNVQFVSIAKANSGNMLGAKYYNGSAYFDGLVTGWFQPKKTVDPVEKPAWISLFDNYFLFIMKPLESSFSGVFCIFYEHQVYSEKGLVLQNAPFVLEKGETKSFKIAYYLGPKKEDILEKIDVTYKEFFGWPIVFYWFMKPIEWVLTQGMFLLASFIPSWGLVIILLSILVKLLLSPLSISGAVSIKRMNLLQPKMKNLQEKYKDDQQKLQTKIAELYKQEGVNPLGGCLPMLAQIPVFFALFRVLSTSVELKNAPFLWFADLTQPDTLFKMSIPLLPAEFNLLPLIYTGITILQSLIQMNRTATGQKQGLMQTLMLPIVFMFVFYSMPSGLVLYFTVQSLYSIVEQEIINLDTKVKLK